jgi:hypothetical protein
MHTKSMVFIPECQGSFLVAAQAQHLMHTGGPVGGLTCCIECRVTLLAC